MNFGTKDIEDVIWRQINQCGDKFNAGIKGGKKKFVKDLADRLYDKFAVSIGESEMNSMDIMAFMNGATEETLKFSRRAGKALGLSNMPQDEISIDAYKWIMQQPQTIEQFADWARTDEGGKFIGKYRKGAGNIKNDWARAFNTGTRMLADDIRI